MSTARMIRVDSLSDDMQELVLGFFEAEKSNAPRPKTLPLRSIPLSRFPDVELADGNLDQRGIPWAIEFLQAFNRGDVMPPLVVNGDRWWDGRHRVWAAKRTGTIQAMEAIDLGGVLPHSPRQGISQLRPDGSAVFGDRLAPDGTRVAANFANWFGDSKVVDRDGSALKLFHGTRKTFDAFRRGKWRPWAANNVLGMFFTRHPDTASGYASSDAGANVVPVYLSLQNPHVQNVYEWQAMQGGSWSIDQVREWKRDLVARGFDGVVDSAGVEFIAFHPWQIKSAIGNCGVFDAESDDIADSQGWNAPAAIPTERQRS